MAKTSDRSKAIQNYINHIAFIVDESGSMSRHRDSTVKVFDGEIAHLAEQSTKLKQETRVSVYLFNNGVECLIFDMDVMRLPSLKSLYHPCGGTALIDATIQGIHDLQKTAQMYADHAFLTYVLTDGEENASINRPTALKSLISSLEENWTTAVFVPDQRGVSEAAHCGFPTDNITTWDVSSAKGLENVGSTIRTATARFMSGRAQGIRGTKTLFVDVANISKTEVKAALDKLPSTDYILVPVNRDATIRDFVEKNTKQPYRKGQAFYELTKKETVQGYKGIALQEKNTSNVYVGDAARSLLGLPNSDTNVKPDGSGRFNIFVESTSHNRKLIGGTKCLIMK